MPKPLPQHRRELLPRILQEWGRIDLRQHLSMASPAIIRKRINRLEKIKASACQLSDALNKLDKRDQTSILWQMIIAEGKRFDDVSRTEFSDRQARLSEVVDYLAKLGAIKPKEYWHPRRGHPRNIPAYQVLKDAAAIFEWLTGTTATREVDRSKGIETGPFFRFASILWPVVFRKGVAGLPAAMKNWAAARSKYNEASALIANIDARYRTWGVIER
ncbi:MAG TPA: hypothetical protein VKG24_19165 [Pseudolabrys sp.]|nr:hypothetical protein [Pseudolabrys sp.]